VRRAVGQHQYVLCIRRPVEHAVVGAAARRQRTGIVVPGQLQRLAAVDRHHEHLSRAVVLRRECDLAAIRGELRVKLQARVRREPLGDAARRSDDMQISGLHERHQVAADVGQTQQARVGGARGKAREHHA
jgi:hypothetical protein